MTTPKTDYNKLAPKKDLKTSSPVNVEIAIKSLVQSDTKLEEKTDSSVKTVRVSVDTPATMIKKIKQRMLDTDVKTLKDYFLGLAKQDLGL
jgi:hypothetical protein